MKKDNYFGFAEIKVGETGAKSLVIPDAYGDSELTVNDGEIKDRDDSAIVAVFTITDGKKEKTFLIHKIDCLALATFLLNIHNEYAEEQNAIRSQEQRDALALNRSLVVSSESNS
jgi:hypothetical protein